MTCPCRTSSLRIFVQSLTRVQLAGSVPGATSHTLGGHTFAQNARVRFLSAASAVNYPRQALRGDTRTTASAPADQGAESHGPSEHPSTQSSTISPGESATVNSAGLFEQARTDKALFDLSPEAIDSPATELSQNPTDPTTSDARRGARPYAPTRRPKPELSGPSRLKRSKILPPNIKKTKEGADDQPRKKEPWMIQKNALRGKFPEGWNPRKRLSPDALDGIRALHTQYPKEFTTEKLAEKFEVSPEAIRRILRAKWRPSAEEDENRQQRWFNRGKNIWSQMAELGMKPPKQWREEGIVRDPRWNQKRGPRTEYPYVPERRSGKDRASVPRRRAEKERDQASVTGERPQKPRVEKSAQRKLGESLL